MRALGFGDAAAAALPTIAVVLLVDAVKLEQANVRLGELRAVRSQFVLDAAAQKTTLFFLDFYLRSLRFTGHDGLHRTRGLAAG